MTTIAERRQRLRDVDLYVVTSREHSAGRTSLEVLDACLAAGVRMVQLREKTLSGDQLRDLAREFRARTRDAGCLLIVNDRVDIALDVDADGVHLGRGDMAIEEARKQAPSLLIGASSHDMYSALNAEAAGADYVNIGPIFPTGTKPEHKVFLGPEAVGLIGMHLHVPFTCMGGINETNIDQVLDGGAQIVALVTAVTKADDIEAAARSLRHRILDHRARIAEMERSGANPWGLETE
ncbi:thiamine phosphate synthase [bacterium]|nr:thiamine phosphate synthase [bacterium]